jgi:hypothetical protein
MSLTLNRVAVKDPSTSDQVILSNILSGVDGSSAIGWSQEGEEVRIEDNQTMEHSHMGDLDIKVLRGTDSELTILNGLIAKKVEISGWTIEGFFRMRGNPLLNRSEDFNSAILNDHIYVTTNAPKGYVLDNGFYSQAFYVGKNALRLYDTKQGSATLLSGFDLDAGVTGSVAGENQTVTSEVKDDGIASKPMFFPFEGVSLVASADFSSATVRFNIGLRFLDATQTLISESVSDYIATGRRSQTALVPAGTVYVQWITTRNEASAVDGGNWTFTRPALRTNSATYAD